MFHKVSPSEGDRGCLCKSPYETAYDYCPDTGEVTWSQLITETQRELSSLIFISLSQFHSISLSLILPAFTLTFMKTLCLTDCRVPGLPSPSFPLIEQWQRGLGWWASLGGSGTMLEPTLTPTFPFKDPSLSSPHRRPCWGASELTQQWDQVRAFKRSLLFILSVAQRFFLLSFPPLRSLCDKGKQVKVLKLSHFLSQLAFIWYHPTYGVCLACCLFFAAFFFFPHSLPNMLQSYYF